MAETLKCPLCESSRTQNVEHRHRHREKFYLCLVCDLIWLDPQSHLSALDEKTRYETHQNSLEDPGYLKFLSPVVVAVEECFSAHRESISGLDFGSGPEPVLAELLRRQGFRVECYDPYFSADESVLVNGAYDFVVSTEVFEHLYSPSFEIRRLQALLRAGGWLVVMTQLHEGPLE